MVAIHLVSLDGTKIISIGIYSFAQNQTIQLEALWKKRHFTQSKLMRKKRMRKLNKKVVCLLFFSFTFDVPYQFARSRMHMTK